MRSSISLFLVERTVWLIAIAGFLIFAAIMPRVFLDLGAIDFVIRSGVSIGLVALGIGICLIAGLIDNSVPAIAGFAGVFTTLFASKWFPGTPWPILLLLAILVGAGLGALNGLLIRKIKIHSFLITLTTYIVFIGARKLLYEGAERMPDKVINMIGGGQIIPGISYSTVIFIVVVAVLWVFMNMTITGMRLYAVGGNPRASALMGVDVDGIRFRAHLIAGILAGLSGILYVGYNEATTPAMLDFNLFDGFAMAIFGGVALTGGRGRIEDIFASMFFLSTLTLAMTIAGINVYLRQTVVGVFILIGIVLNMVREKIRDRILMQMA
ncbi:MAG: ABC transporter permease [Thaumarchaeota archaeon]|jgi:ribose/xylose/arabinose/galactoside ABC-type transport system permease subunit|nr:ABC transporter permease [Candidatus Wolframiiraptor allenii]